MCPPPIEQFEDSTAVHQIPFSSHDGDVARALIRATSCFGQGVWSLHSAINEDPVFRIEIVDDLLVDLERCGHRSLLHRALLKDSLLKQRDLQKLEQRGLEDKSCPGVICLEKGILDPSQAADAIEGEISFDLLEVLKSKEGFWKGPFLQPIDSGIRGRVEIGLNLQQAFLRSARRNKAWDLISELPLLREVMFAGPSAFSLIQQEEISAEVRSLLEMADGQKDLFEMTRHRADSWRALDRALDLFEVGHLQGLSAIQLFQLGEAKMSVGESESALRHWRRAEEKGLDDFDICGRMGEICARSHRHEEAVQRLRQHARKSTEQLRFEAARQAWTELVCLDPHDEEAIDRAVQLWIKEPGSELSDCLRLAESLKRSGRWNEVAELLSGVGGRQPDARLHRMHGEAARALGDDEMELKAMWRQAECLRTGIEPLEAIPVYRELKSRDYQEELASLRLVELQLHQGEISAARESLGEVLSGKSGATIHGCEESLAILHSCSRKESVPIEILDFLYEVQSGRGNQEVARQYLIQMMDCDPDGSYESLLNYRVKNWLTKNDSDYSLFENWIDKIADNSPKYEMLNSIQFVLKRMNLTPDQRVEVAGKGLEIDPSNPSFLRILISSKSASSEEKDEWYRRFSLRSLAEGGEISVQSFDTLNKGTDWRTPLLNLVCQRRSLSESESGGDVKAILTDGNYLRKLLLEHAEMDEEFRGWLNSLEQEGTVAVASSGRATVVRSSIGGITEKLKNLHGEPQASNTQVMESADSSSADTSREETVAVASGQGGASSGIQSALDRLKAMRSPDPASAGAGDPEKSDKDRQDIPTSMEERKPPSGNAQPKVNAAIARLGALRNGGNLATGVDEERRDP